MKTFRILKSGPNICDYVICDENGKRIDAIDELCILIKATSNKPVATIILTNGTVIQGYIYHINAAATVVP